VIVFRTDLLLDRRVADRCVRRTGRDARRVVSAEVVINVRHDPTTFIGRIVERITRLLPTPGMAARASEPIDCIGTTRTDVAIAIGVGRVTRV
ncbi:hypothetical protein N9L76_11120, partial [bacterium]|nr:hypothetical protein [bacterium]